MFALDGSMQLARTQFDRSTSVPTRTQQLGLILLLVALTIYVFLRVR